MPVDMIIADDEILTERGFYWREAGGIKVLCCTALETAGFANGYSTRIGGVSPFPAGDLNLAGFNEDTKENILENRRRFLSAFDGGYRLATVWQVHGNAVKIVSDLDRIDEDDEKFDAVASQLPGVLIGVKTADCVPVLIGDERNGAYAAIHAGWRGTAASIVNTTIKQLQTTFGSRPADLICSIGPAATCNYEIGDDVIDAFSHFAGNERYFEPTRKGHAFVDLHLANKDQLLSAGVAESRIFTAPFCTLDRTDLFFSYRKEKHLNGKTGRLLSVIGKA